MAAKSPSQPLNRDKIHIIINLIDTRRKRDKASKAPKHLISKTQLQKLGLSRFGLITVMPGEISFP
jgi:hypothetical protein